MHETHYLQFLLLTVNMSGLQIRPEEGNGSINKHDLKMHMQFLASDELEGQKYR